MSFSIKSISASVAESWRDDRGAWKRASLLLIPVVVMYYDTFLKILADWWKDPNNSHGLLIPPLALYFAWRKRRVFMAQLEKPSTAAGMILVLGSLFVYFVGRLGAEFFLTRISSIGLLAGLLLFF